MSNSVDLDETDHYEPSHLDLCCLQQPVIIACGSERVKTNCGRTWHVFHIFIYQTAWSFGKSIIYFNIIQKDSASL